ncbi:unnamed protein product, partial [Iphiclides podalirius]
MWYLREYIFHKENKIFTEVNPYCPIVHLRKFEDYVDGGLINRNLPTPPTSYLPLTNSPYVSRSYGLPEQYRIRHFVLEWNEGLWRDEYHIKVNTSHKGFWPTDVPNGSVEKMYRFFGGVIQVLKVAKNHLVLNFCMRLPHSQLYSVVLSRNENQLTPEDLAGIHNIFTMKHLSTSALKLASVTMYPVALLAIFTAATPQARGLCGESIRWSHSFDVDDIFGLWYGVGYAQHTPDMTNKPDEIGCVSLYITDATYEVRNDWLNWAVPKNNNNDQIWRSYKSNPWSEYAMSGSWLDIPLKRPAKRSTNEERRIRVLWDEDGQTMEQIYLYSPEDPGIWIAEKLRPLEREMRSRGIDIWYPDDPPRHPEHGAVAHHCPPHNKHATSLPSEDHSGTREMYRSVAILTAFVAFTEGASYQRYDETTRYPSYTTIANIYNQYPYRTGSYGSDIATFPDAGRYPNYNLGYSTTRYNSYNTGSNAFMQPGYTTPQYGTNYGQDFTSYEAPFMKNVRDYCVNRSPQTGIWVEHLTGMWTVMGVWKVAELYMHLSKEGVITYNSCPIITIWETDVIPRSTFGPSTENQLFHVQHINAKFRQEFRHLRLLWNEAGQTIEYALYFRNDSAGYWQVFDGQNGTLTNRPSYQQFSGTVQVLKAVNDHLLLNFCQEGTVSSPAQLYSVLFSRDPGRMPRWERDSVHTLLQNKKLSVASRRIVCGNSADRPYGMVVSIITCLLAYAISLA